MPTGVYKRKTSQTLAQKKRAKKVGLKNKGNLVKYVGLHDWIRRMLGKPLICNLEDVTCKGIIEWVNISGKYKRDVNDFISLCRSHHRRFDYGRKK